jgi:hypothetical protein
MTQPPNPGSPAPGSPTPDNAAPTQPYPAAGYPAPVAQPYAPAGQPYPTPGYQTPADRAPAPTSTGREILRMGWWNYVMLRWGPKNSAARFAVEMALLIAFFLVLAILAKLASS